MAEVMHNLVNEAKKNRFSAIPKLTEEDVVNVWDIVSQYIERQMTLHKGVNIPGLGTFTFTQKKLEVGNNKFILIQRPVFIVSEKFAMTHALTYTKHHTSGQIPVVKLNFAALSNDTPFDRDTVESCVKEVLQALARSIQSKRNVEFNFSGIGRLSIRETKVKMKFFKDFLKSMDGSGNLVQALSNRPGTADSVLSETLLTPRPHTSNTLILPRIQPGVDLQLKAGKDTMPAIPEQEEAEDAAEEEAEQDVDEEDEDSFKADDNEILREEVPKVDLLLGDVDQKQEEGCAQTSPGKMTPPTRAQLQTPKASGISFPEKPSPTKTPKSPRKTSTRTQSRGPKPATAPADADRAQRESFEESQSQEHQPPRVLTPPAVEMSLSRSGCRHGERGGQELCYLCHQRAQRNIPVYLAEERHNKEMEEDRLLQQYQQQKDAETIIKEQVKNLDNRKYCQKVAAFNLGVAEAIKSKKTERPTEFCRSYVFQNRPMTPPRGAIQEKYSKELADQVRVKHNKLSKLKKEQEFLDRLEQVQLAEDLAIQRENYLRDKKIASDLYKKALDTQIRFKPLPIPALEPDSLGPIFGIYDTTDEKLEEKNSRARKLYLDQLDMVEQKKRQAILKDLKNQKEESDMLERTRRDIIVDRALRHQERLEMRKSLEESWAENAAFKKHREFEEKRRAMSPGMLIHEQCDKYRRCKQCGRKGTNCGESNVWSESRYIPGSRLMV